MDGYNTTPKWAIVRSGIRYSNLVCRDCKESLGVHFMAALARAQTSTYDHPAHIPPTLIVTCPACGTDWEIEIEARVVQVGDTRKC